MYPYEHMTAMECKEVCIPGEVQILVLGVSYCAALFQDVSCVLQTANTLDYGERENNG